MTITKEYLAKHIPEQIECWKEKIHLHTCNLVYALLSGDRETERVTLAIMAKLVYRIDRAEDALLSLHTMQYELDAGLHALAFNEDAADAWWTMRELERADAEMRDCRNAAFAADIGKVASGDELLKLRAVGICDVEKGKHRCRRFRGHPLPHGEDFYFWK